jgi:hypothetical protein
MTDASDQRVPTPLAHVLHAIRATGTPVEMVVISVTVTTPPTRSTAKTARTAGSTGLQTTYIS